MVSAYAQGFGGHVSLGVGMNALLLNRESFELPGDGGYHLAPLGVFPHAGAGVVQVVDAEACGAMAAAFGVEAAGMNFAGLLIDFDHFSLDAGNKSEAAGWIVDLEARTGGMSRTENTESSWVTNAGGSLGVVEILSRTCPKCCAQRCRRGHGGSEGEVRGLGCGRRFAGRTRVRRRCGVAGIGICRRFGRGRIVWTLAMGKCVLCGC